MPSFPARHFRLQGKYALQAMITHHGGIIGSGSRGSSSTPTHEGSSAATRNHNEGARKSSTVTRRGHDPRRQETRTDVVTLTTTPENDRGAVTTPTSSHGRDRPDRTGTRNPPRAIQTRDRPDAHPRTGTPGKAGRRRAARRFRARGQAARSPSRMLDRLALSTRRTNGSEKNTVGGFTRCSTSKKERRTSSSTIAAA